MIRKPENYDEVEVRESGSYETLKLGGHKCVIVGAENFVNPISGKESLRIYLDTASDDIQPNYFSNIYKNNMSPDRKWDNRGTIYLPLGNGEFQVKKLKGGIKAIENSNSGYTFNWDETTLKGKKVACEFGLEEYKRQDGTIGTKIQARNLRSLDKIDKIEIPDVRLLEKNDEGNTMYANYQEYMREKSQENTKKTIATTIDINNLPF